MLEIKGFTVTSVRSKMDQDAARRDEAGELLDYGFEVQETAERRLSFMHKTIVIPVTLILFNQLSPSSALQTIAIISIFIPVLYLIYIEFSVRRCQRLFDKFKSTREAYNLAVWGQKDTATVIFKRDRLTELYEVQVLRNDGMFIAGHIREDDSMILELEQQEEYEDEIRYENWDDDEYWDNYGEDDWDDYQDEREDYGDGWE